MAGFGSGELIIILVIVILIFGAGRLTSVGKGLGGAINEFKNAVGQDENEEESTDAADEEKT